MPVYEYRCDSCGKITEVFKRMSERTETELCRFCTGIARQVFSRVAVVCHWGTGCVKGERQGYIPGVDNPKAEIPADMKALEEKRAHEDDPKRRHKMGEALKNFAEANKDILR